MSRVVYKAYFLWVIPQGVWDSYPPTPKWWAKPFMRMKRVEVESATAGKE